MEYLNPLDSTDCGPTCLRMIANHYGREYSSNFLRKINYLNRQGVSIYNLGKAAEQIGFKAIVGELSLKYLTEKAALPCILYWDKSHFVVLHHIKKCKKLFSKETIYEFHLADPGTGKIKLDEATFTKYWLGDMKKGFGLFLEPTTVFYSYQSDEDKPQKTTLKSAYQFLATYFSRYKQNYFQVVVSMALAAFISLLFPFLTQSIVDVGIAQKDIDFIKLVLFFQLALFLSNTFSDIIRSHLLLHISARINISILSDFLTKLMKLPMSFFDSKMSGDLVQRINDHQRIEQFITSSLLTTAFSVINLVVFTVVLLNYNFTIFAVFIVGSLCSVVWTLLFMRWRKSLDYKRFRALSSTNEKLYEMVNQMPEIKLNGFEKYKQWEWQEIQVRLFKLDISHLTLEQYQRIGSDFFDQLKNITITFFSAYSVIRGEITFGMMLAISYIVGQLNVPIHQLISFFNVFQTTKIGIERMNEVYGEEDEEKGESITQLSQPKNSFEGIELHNVSFRYGGSSSEKVLKNIDLQIPKGKTTAIVGSSGSGKSTLIKLLLKFYQPSEGQIMLNGFQLEKLSTNWWREQCGSVMQEGHIFSDTIKRNVIMSDEVGDSERLVQAVDMANISDFILELPLHFETQIGDAGIGISTGQKQRILIARAIYKNPDYLFFDEATSSLDAKNERIIVENLNEFTNGGSAGRKTVIVVAHRLSTVKNADQIVVLEKGEVMEVGTHKELVHKKGHYFNLISNQLELGE